MKKKTFTLSPVISISVSAAVFITGFILTTVIQKNALVATGRFFLILFYAVVFTVLAMTIKRIITTLWGSFREGLMLNILLGSVFYCFLSFFKSGGGSTFLYVLFLISSSVLFNLYERFLLVSSMSLDKKGGIRDEINRYLGALKKIWDNLFAVTKKHVLKIYDKVRALAAQKKYSLPAAVSLGAVVAAFILYKVFIYFFCVTVAGYQPLGVVPVRTTIVATFSENVSLPENIIEKLDSEDDDGNGKGGNADKVNDSNDTLFVKRGVHLFNIKPSIKGSYRIEDGRSIVFVPDGDLLPSREYSVSINTEKLRSQKTFIIGKSFSFSTPRFKVTGSNIFYNYDFIKNVEKEVVCEINFNYPVDIRELIKHSSMHIDNDPVKLTIEPSNIPTRFYLKYSPLARKDSETRVHFEIKADLGCISGGMALKDDFERTEVLPEKVKLQVARAEALPVEANTYIALLFNRPVSGASIKKFVKVLSPESKEVEFKVETEYCYAVLKADFKPNKMYKVIVAKGMMARTGEVFNDEYSCKVSVEDLNSQVKFSTKGQVLPLRGNLDIELYTVNLDRFDVKIEKVFRNNLAYFLKHSGNSEFGKSLLMKTYDVEGGELNQRVNHFINLRKFHSMDYRGLYVIRLSDTRDYWNYDQQYILCTDLGIIAKESGSDLNVKVYSIMDLVPVAGVTVKLLSHENQVIHQAVTGEGGDVVIRDWKINKHDFEPLAIVAEQGDDFSFLEFSQSELEVSRFNIGGENIPEKGLKAFLTPERGVYRPGEKAFITVIVRKGDLSNPQPLDAQLYVSDPTEEKFTVIKKKIPGHGMMSFEVKFPTYAKTGRYNLQLRLNEKIILGRTTLKVEEFIPDKIKTEVKAPKKRVAPGKAVIFTVKGTQLFGPPAADRKVKTHVKFLPRTFAHERFKDYSFSDNERAYAGEIFDLGAGKLDERGEKSYTVNVPSTVSPPSALTARVYTEVFDSGGRPVSAVKNIKVDHYSAYIGLRIDRRDVYLKNQPVGFSYVAIDPGGKYKIINKGQIVIKHKVYYTILQRMGLFNEKYQSETYEEVVDHKDIVINKTGRHVFVPRAPGEYTIYVNEVNGMRSSRKIYVQGPGMVSMNLEDAKNLSINFNKKKYTPGERAVVTIHSPIPGRAFFSIEREKEMYTANQVLVNKKATFEFIVGQEHIPNVYVSALVIRRPDASLKKMPMSAMGVRNMEMDPGGRKIRVTLNHAAEARSQRELPVSVQATPGARVVLAAVDEGILQITQYKTPDPFNSFFSKRALLTRLYSIFDAVLPNVKATKLAIGGDEGAYDMSRRHINPFMAKRVKSVSLYSGVLTADEGGAVYHRFKIPEFNGKLRIMAIAADGMRFGAASRYVTVADPIVISPSYPRLLAPGDRFEIPVYVYNKTGMNGPCAISIETEGPLKVNGPSRRSIFIPNKSEKMIYFFCRSLEDAGKAVITIKARIGKNVSSNRVEMPVRPARGPEAVTRNGSLKKGETVKIKVPGGFMKYGQRIELSLSPNYMTKFLSTLDYLVNYPYGCAEQVASTAFPLIFYGKLSRNIGLFRNQAGAADRYVNEAIKILESMQRKEGEFSVWPGGMDYLNPYVSDYVSHFLIEASLHGYEVDEEVMKKIRGAIGVFIRVKKGRLDRREDFSQADTGLYKLYLKSLLGKPDYETMQYIKKERINDLSYVQQCWLSLCYALKGEKETARQLLPSKFKMKYFPRKLGGDFDSVVKRMSLYLMALCAIDAGDPSRFKVAREITGLAKKGIFETTHDSVYALLALSKVFGPGNNEAVKAKLLVNGKLLKDISRGETLSVKKLSGKEITLVNEGDERLYYNFLAEGTPVSGTSKTSSKGIEVTRKYFNKDGEEINLASVVQGQLIVETITLEPDRDDLDNVVVVDMLPAGFEIENLRIRSRGKLGFTPLSSWRPYYEDFRDDRLVLFSGPLTKTVSYSYTLRAVSVGSYIIPRIYAEAMYDPEVRSVAKPMGKVHVVRGGI